MLVAIDEHAPAVYLAKDPTPEGKLLTEQVDQHAGAHVPFWMFAELAVRQHRDAAWIGGMEDIRRRVRRNALAALGALAVNLAAIGGYAAHRIAAGATADERALQLERSAVERRDAVERELQDLRLDVRALWAALHRLSGIEPPPSSDIDDPDAGLDKFSSISWPAPQSGVAPASLTPASTGGGPNGEIGCWRQRPALQNRHDPPNWRHSELLVQKLRHPPSGLGVGVFDTGCDGLLQAAIATAMMSNAMWCIPHL